MDAACDLCRRALCAEPMEQPGAEPRLDPTAHLAACPSCRAYSEALGSGLGDLRSMAVLSPAGNPLGRALAAAAKPRRAPRWPFALAAAAAVAAAAWMAVVRPLPQSALQEAADKAVMPQAAGPAAVPAAKQAARQTPGTDSGSQAKRALSRERRPGAATTRRDAAADEPAKREVAGSRPAEPARPAAASLRSFGAEARPSANADALGGMAAAAPSVAGPAAAPVLTERRNVAADTMVAAAPVTLTLAEMPAPELAARLARALDRPLRVDAALAEVRLGLRCVERPASEVLQAVAAATEARWAPVSDALLLTQAAEAEEAAASGPAALKAEAFAVGGRMGGAAQEMRAQEGFAAPAGMAGGGVADGAPTFGRTGKPGIAKQDRSLAVKMQMSRSEAPRNAVTVRWPHARSAARMRRNTAPALPPNWAVTTEAGAQAGTQPAGR